LITWQYFGPSTERENRIVGGFVSRGIWGHDDGFSSYCTLAIFNDAELIAGCVYHNWHPDAGVIEYSGYSKSKLWLTRPVINAMYDLPFERLGCQLVVLRVSERDAPMQRIARSFGYSEVYIPRLRSRDEGEFIFSYTDDQWKASPFNAKNRS
jgi:RimJ/RimL family protein N-acetyltransferase